MRKVYRKLKKIFHKAHVLLPCVVFFLVIGITSDLFASQEAVEKVVEGTKNLFINNSTKTVAAIGIAILGIVSFIQRRIAWALMLFGLAAIVSRIDMFVEFLKSVSIG